MSSTCTHQNSIQEVSPSASGCEECLAMGDRWVHLRLCLNCGHVGCCDSSKNKHATKHFHEVIGQRPVVARRGLSDSTDHPIVKSFEPGEDWQWCYIDKTFV